MLDALTRNINMDNTFVKYSVYGLAVYGAYFLYARLMVRGEE